MAQANTSVNYCLFYSLQTILPTVIKRTWPSSQCCEFDADCLIRMQTVVVPGVKVSDLTGLKWPSNACKNLPDETSNTATVPS